MADKVVVVASYNMSFMSDMTLNRKGSNFASEATFLQPVFEGEEEGEEEEEEGEGEGEEEEKEKGNYFFDMLRSKKQKQKEEEKKKNKQKLKEFDKLKQNIENNKKKERLKKERQDDKNENRRQYWTNAKDKLLGKFIQVNCSDKPFVIGLQEMNLTLVGDTGSNAITTMLEGIVDIKDRYNHVCREINTIFKGKPALSIIYDKEAFGNELANRIIDNWIKGQEGRPLLMVITEKRFVFVNIHGGQEPSKGNPYEGGDRTKFNESIVKLNKEFLEKSVETFCRFAFYHEFNDGKKFTEEPFHIFIMGDLNDRYDAITEFNIFGEKLRYNGESPKSCCHNWDSACSDKNYKDKNTINDRYDQDIQYYDKTNKEIKYKMLGYTSEDFNKFTPKQQQELQKIKDEYCEIPENNWDNDKLKMPMPHDESIIENYRFKGDKVFGSVFKLNEKEIEDYQQKKKVPTGVIKIFDYDERYNKRSTESDHELVFATFPLPTLTDTYKGGKRRSKTRKHHSNKSKNNRRTR
jgi:hypothetical protein